MIDLTKLTQELVRQHNAGPKLAEADGSGTVKYKHRVYPILVRVVRMLPIFCKTCDSMRFRHRYDMCRECWIEYCRLTREALWTDYEDAPPAPWPPKAGVADKTTL